MLPFIYIGSLRLGTYGIMMATGLFVAYRLLRVDLARRRLNANALVMILVIAIVGFIFSRLYYAILNFSLFRFNPALLFSRFGHSFYGAVFGGIAAVFMLARHYRLSTLALLDSIAPEAAIGYGIGRLGCLLAGDGDYGVPTTLPWGMSFPHGIVPTVVAVHPTPIYEFLASACIAWYLWRLGRPSVQQVIPSGQVFAQYLIWSGLARFLVEFVRRNPKVIFGLTNPQAVGFLSIVAGIILLAAIRAQSQKFTTLS